MKYLHSVSFSLLTFSFTVSPAVATSEFTPIISFNIVSDDNVYRIDSDVDKASLPNTISKADRIHKTTVGGGLDWTYKRQEVKILGLLEDNRFDENAQLDNLGQTLKADWSWRLGNDFFGIVNAERNVRLSDFANTTSQEKSEKTDEKFGFSFNWNYHPSWKLGLTGNGVTSVYDTKDRQLSELKRRVRGLIWGYYSKTGSNIAFKYQVANAEYPNRIVQSNSFIDKEYDQESLLLDVGWKISGKSQLDAEFGLVSRDHPIVQQRDYDGVNLDIGYRLAYSSKLVFNAEVFKRITSSNDLLANYYERTGINLSSLWAYSDKVRLNAILDFEERDYSGQTGFIDGLSSSLVEKYNSTSLGVDYEPTGNFRITLSYRLSNRDSSRQLRDYDSTMLSFGVTVNL